MWHRSGTSSVAPVAGGGRGTTRRDLDPTARLPRVVRAVGAAYRGGSAPGCRLVAAVLERRTSARTALTGMGDSRHRQLDRYDAPAGCCVPCGDRARVCIDSLRHRLDVPRARSEGHRRSRRSRRTHRSRGVSAVDLAANGEIAQVVTFVVADIGAAVAHLEACGLRVDHPAPGHAVIHPDDALGVCFRFADVPFCDW